MTSVQSRTVAVAAFVLGLAFGYFMNDMMSPPPTAPCRPSTVPSVASSTSDGMDRPVRLDDRPNDKATAINGKGIDVHEREENNDDKDKAPPGAEGGQVDGAFGACPSHCCGGRRRAADPAVASALPTFKQISDRNKDDKTFRHRYDIAYSEYLDPLRERLMLRPDGAASTPAAFAMLEIGLGCDQLRIGASVGLWTEYLPFARLTTFEFDSKCGVKWLAEEKAKASGGGPGPKGGFHLYFGDQANRNDLQTMLRAEEKLLGGAGVPLYDLIIDDGGHTMAQQQTSFEVLWQRLKRGGVYVIEDINTSFKTRYGGTRRPNCTSPTTLQALVKPLIDRVHALPVPGHPGKFLEDLEFKSPIARVDCFHFICFITKR